MARKLWMVSFSILCRSEKLRLAAIALGIPKNTHYLGAFYCGAFLSTDYLEIKGNIKDWFNSCNVMVELIQSSIKEKITF